MQATVSSSGNPAWLRLGFRPFFLAAGVYACVSILIWFAAYIFGWHFPFAGLSPMTWHAHEMVFGYSMAVVAGFLLTAVRNWTGIATLRGPSLLLIFIFWLLARLFLLAGGSESLMTAASFDLLFSAVFLGAITWPLLRARQWANLAIAGKILLLWLSNLFFYLGAVGVIEQAVYWGLYSGLYLVLALVLTISRRVLPFFIERGIGYPVQLRNNRWVDISSMVLFLGFWMTDLFEPNGMLVSWIAASLFILHLWRMAGWYTAGIWKKPLLWVLYLAYASIVVGFALKSAVYWLGLSPYLALHAFAVGGIGMMTIGMMTRVALGHTGRNVFEPPPVLFWMFTVLLAGVVVRVVLPLFSQEYYRLWIALSQGLWILAFLAFFVVYLPILTQPRLDGRDG